MPLGFALAHIVATGKPDPGSLTLALTYVALVLSAHVALVLLGHRGDQLLFPLAATIGGVGLVMLNRLPQGLAGMNLFGLSVGMAQTQLVWFAVSLVAMVAIAVFFRDDGILRHYKYSWALAGAAVDVGIGLTILPVLYERAGFMQPALRDDQRRFAATPERVHALFRTVADARRPLVNAGVAIHSLRAASHASMVELMRRIGDGAVPVHIHIAEQTAEVDDCVESTGARPIEWLCRKLRPDARWQLVHATHATPSEIDAVAATGAGIVVCPSTEANLGDGLTDLPRWLTTGVPLALGSDSQVSRSWPAELRWLEYGQRLVRRERNVAAAPTHGQPATAARLFDTIVAGDGRSAGLIHWGLVPGARADALVLDARSPGLLGVPPSHALDALVFATDAPQFREVYVRGRRVISDGRHGQEAAISDRFSEAMDELWGGSNCL